ncbi:MAG: substrate-binding domain-containing protein [Chloroflexota bacterium]|jgi:rhamnose transport system substrate-binding protein
MLKRLYLIGVILLALSMILVACGSDEPAEEEVAPTEEAAPAEEEEMAPTEEAAPAEEEEMAEGEALDIVYIPKNTGNPYFDSIIRGFEQACMEIGCNFTTTAPATAEATSQIPFVEEQIQRGVDVLAISPNSPDALNDVFDQASEAGIVVLIVNSDIPGSEEHRDAAVLPMDFDITGASQVELMGSLIDYEGKIAILSATADAPDQNYWIEGMEEALQDEKYAGMELVTIVYGDDDPQKSLTECEGLLANYPDLRGIISPTTVGVAASAQCVESAGVYPGGENAVGEGLQVTGLGTPNQMRRFVEDGIVEAFALWSPYDEGYLSTYLGADLANDEVEAAEGNTFEVPNLGERSFRENAVVITGPPTVFTADNIGDFDF